MPLPMCISSSNILETEVEEEPHTSQKIIALARKLLTQNDWETSGVGYVMDISLHNRVDPDEPLDTASLYDSSTIGDDDSDDTIATFRESTNLVDWRRYEISFSEEGRASLKNFSHKPKIYDGEITNVVVQIAKKPTITYRGLKVPIKHYKFNEAHEEHEVHLSLKEVYGKALQELQGRGFPKLKTPQNYRLKLSFYYLDELIARKTVLFNPHHLESAHMARLHGHDDAGGEKEEGLDVDEHDEDEYLVMLPDRPDHVRLHDVRLENMSLFWLQEWINKVLDERLAL